MAQNHPRENGTESRREDRQPPRRQRDSRAVYAGNRRNVEIGQEQNQCDSAQENITAHITRRGNAATSDEAVLSKSSNSLRGRHYPRRWRRCTTAMILSRSKHAKEDYMPEGPGLFEVALGPGRS